MFENLRKWLVSFVLIECGKGYWEELGQHTKLMLFFNISNQFNSVNI